MSPIRATVASSAQRNCGRRLQLDGGTTNLLQRDTIALIPKEFTVVTIPVMVSLEGDYTVTIAPVASVDGWQVKMQNPLGAAGSSSQGTFHPALGVLQSVQFAVLAPAYTPPGGTLALTIQRASESSRATRLFPLLGL